MQNKKFFRLFGYIFLAWAIFDVIFKIHVYGFRELDFIWFCSIAMFMLAFGLILKNETILNSFLSMALLFQPVFILDYIWISFFNIELNGTAAYIFQPGFTLLEFLSTVKHLLIIPFAFYGVFALSKKRARSYLLIPSVIISLLVFSYMFSLDYKNLNCALKPCFKFFGEDLSGFKYLISFMIITIALSLLINLIINLILQKFEKIRNKKTYKKSIFIIFAILLGISLISVAAASFKYSKLQRYYCAESDKCENCTIYVRCKYITGVDKNLTLAYVIKNKGNQNYACNISIKISPIDIDYRKIGEDYSIRATRIYKIRERIEYHEVDSEIKLKPVCKAIL